MKPYLLSLVAGLLVGGIYSLINVRSPAPPAIALVGLLGILIGEQAVPLVRGVFVSSTAPAGTVLRQCGQHVFGRLPGRGHGATDHQTPGDRT